MRAVKGDIIELDAGHGYRTGEVMSAAGDNGVFVFHDLATGVEVSALEEHINRVWKPAR